MQQQNYTHDLNGNSNFKLPSYVDNVSIQFGFNGVNNYTQFNQLFDQTILGQLNFQSGIYSISNFSSLSGQYVDFKQNGSISAINNCDSKCKTCYNKYECYECNYNQANNSSQYFSYSDQCLSLDQCERQLGVNISSLSPQTFNSMQYYKCENPIENCIILESLTKCKECSQNYFSLIISPSTVHCINNLSLQPFQYVLQDNSTTIIIQCVSNCNKCSNTTICEECEQNAKYNNETGQCEIKCPSGHKRIGDGSDFQCNPCKVSGCQSCDSDIDKCDICDQGKYNMENLSCSSQGCELGYQPLQRNIDTYCMPCQVDQCISCENYYYKCEKCNTTDYYHWLENNTCVGCGSQRFYDYSESKCKSCNPQKCVSCKHNENYCTWCINNITSTDGNCCSDNEELDPDSAQCIRKEKSKLIYYIIGGCLITFLGLLILVLVSLCKKKKKKEIQQQLAKLDEITTPEENIEQQSKQQIENNNEIKEPLIQQENGIQQQEFLKQKQYKLNQSFLQQQQKQEAMNETRPFLFSSGSNSGKSDNSTNSQSSIPNLQDTVMNPKQQILSQSNSLKIDQQKKFIRQSLMNQVSNQLQIKNKQNLSPQLQSNNVPSYSQIQSQNLQQLSNSIDILNDTQQTEIIDSPKQLQQQHLIIKNLEQSIQQQVSNQTIRMDESSQFLQDNDVPTISMPEFKQKYELIDNLGEGSFGFVEKYYSHQLQKEVAIKRSKCFSHKDFFNQGAQEAIALKKMNKLCPYILKLEDCFVIGQKKEQQPPIINKKQWNNSELKLQIKNDLQLCLDLGNSQDINIPKIKKDMQQTKILENQQLGHSMLGISQELGIQPKDNLQNRNNQDQQQVLGTSNMVSMFKSSKINIERIDEQTEENLNSQESKERSNQYNIELQKNQEDSTYQSKDNNMQEQQQLLQQSEQISQYMQNKNNNKYNQEFQFGNNKLSCQQSGQLCLVLELGQYSLFDEIQQRQIHSIPFQTKELLKVAYETLTALNALHQFMKMAHRDIKPQNILFINPNYKLCDLGIAKNYENSMSVTNNHTMSGTLNYFSPEEKRNYIYFLQNQEQEQQPFNVFKADIFALGLTMLQAATLQGITGLNDSIQKLQTALQVLFSIPYLDEKIKLLISGMLVWDAKQRLDTQQLLDIIAK